jgi:hypothetical protein
MYNSYAVFKSLIPLPQVQIGVVASIADGVASITLPGGQVITARGSATVGQSVFVKDGVIDAVAPVLPLVAISI